MSLHLAKEQGDRGEEVHVLWAPWRMRYIEEGKPSGCIFCSPTEETALRRDLVLGLTPHSRVMLNKYPYNNGHLLVAPQRHTAVLADLPEGEFTDLMALLRRAVAVLDTALHPQGINIGLNLGAGAGAGDTNFMSVVGAVRVMPQHLLESYDRLRPFFAPPTSPAGGGAD